MEKIGFVFPGQGVQTVGMAKDFFDNSQTAKEIFQRASDAVHLDMETLCFEENDRLNQTEYTQCALLTACMAMEAEVRKAGITPFVCGGLSLGEYCAVTACGGMSFDDAVKSVRQRGILMDGAMEKGVGAMAAVLGLTGEQVEACVSQVENAFVANYNCPGQIVITGLKNAVEKAGELLVSVGAKRVVPLNVSGAFHSPFLRGTGNLLEEVLKQVKWHSLNIPYVTNVTGELVEDIKKTPELLKKQVYSSVRWEQSVRTMLEAGVGTFVEIGPGRTVNGFIRKIDRDVKTVNIGTYGDLEKLNEM